MINASVEIMFRITVYLHGLCISLIYENVQVHIHVLFINSVNFLLGFVNVFWFLVIVGSLLSVVLCLSLVLCCQWFFVVIGSLLSLVLCCHWFFVVVGSLLLLVLLLSLVLCHCWLLVLIGSLLLSSFR